MKTQEYIGRIVSIPGNDGFAFIGIASTAKSDGSPHDLPTKADIFLHRDDCGSALKVGMTVSFDAAPDHKRGTGYCRAFGAVEHLEPELLSKDEPMPGFAVLAPFAGNFRQNNLVVMPTPAQLAKMKPVPTEIVGQVIENNPAPTMARDSSVPDNKDELMKLFLEHLFPTMAQFGSEFDLEGNDTVLDGKVAEAKADQEALDMGNQNVVMETEVARYKSFRGAINFMSQEGLVRRDTIVPIRYLPDFFMACPVWFFWTNKQIGMEATSSWENTDPTVQESTHYFCDLFPNQKWADTFQMFNRRVRPLSMYKGDIIPPHVLRRIRETAKLFDYLVVMTPYHDVAGKEWSNPEWVRSIDPYVVGFKKGIPYFFVIARFSDSGTFPLFNELVADTVMFLEKNKTKLTGFNAVNNPYWHICRKGGEALATSAGPGLGTHLIRVVDELLAAFKAGRLFDWLRGETDVALSK